jgi:phage tail protein X
MKLDYIHRKLYAKEIGITDNVVKNWMSRHWTKGTHYKVVGKQTFVNVHEANKWLANYGPE